MATPRQSRPNAVADLSSAVYIKAIYTDGACSGNPGPGGWGTRIELSDGQVQELGGAEPNSTNNRMEMQAAIAALEYITAHPDLAPPQQPMTLHIDSEYVLKGITQWIKGWKRKGWKTAQGKPVLNQDLWQALDALNHPQVTWQHVRGHAGVPGNERCDAIATGFAAGRPPRLAQCQLAEPPAAMPSLLSTASNETASSPGVRSGQKSEIKANKPESSSKFTDNSGFSVTEHVDSQEDTLGWIEATFNAEIHTEDRLTEHSMDHESSQSHESSGNLPREVRVAQVRNMVDTLNMADEIADKGYLISSSELADLMDVNASAVTSRGEQWVWRNWVVSRVRREGNQILWQLERVD